MLKNYLLLLLIALFWQTLTLSSQPQNKQADNSKQRKFQFINMQGISIFLFYSSASDATTYGTS